MQKLLIVNQKLKNRTPSQNKSLNKKNKNNNNNKSNHKTKEKKIFDYLKKDAKRNRR